MIQQTAKQLNDIALQRAQSRDRTEVSLFNIQQQKLQAQSQVGLQAAASGTMGASVKDAVATVNTVAGRQEASVRDQQATQEEGLRLMTDKAVDSGLASMDMEDPYDNMFNSLRHLLTLATHPPVVVRRLRRTQQPPMTYGGVRVTVQFIPGNLRGILNACDSTQ